MKEKPNRQEWITLMFIAFAMPILIFSSLVCGSIRNMQVAGWLLLIYSMCAVWMATVYVEKGKSFFRRILMFCMIEIVPLAFYAIGILINVILF